MGGGTWTRASFEEYSRKAGRAVDASGNLDKAMSSQQIFRAKGLNPKLDPKDVIRECCDSAEHPNSMPVILALDVTGSMGRAAAAVAQKLNSIMTTLFTSVDDVEFCVMAIGDLAYDKCPIQISQFESDIRIAEQMDQVYFEYGGGGNNFESYTAAWYMALKHTRLDCHKRGLKGLIITLGDELLNPYLPAEPLSRVTGDYIDRDIETGPLRADVSKWFEMYHLSVDDSASRHYANEIKASCDKFLGADHWQTVSVDGVPEAISAIVMKHAQQKPRVDGSAVITDATSPKAAAPEEDKPAGLGFFGGIKW